MRKFSDEIRGEHLKLTEGLQLVCGGLDEVRDSQGMSNDDLEQRRSGHDVLSGHIVDIGEQQAELRDSQATTSALRELEATNEI